MVNYKNTKSSGNHKNYIGGNATIDGTKKRKKHLWRMDQKTLEHRGIRILDVTRLFFIPTKQSNSKYVEGIKMSKKMGEGEETWASKVGLITLLDIDLRNQKVKKQKKLNEISSKFF